MKAFGSQSITPETALAPAKGAQEPKSRRLVRRQSQKTTLVFWCFVGPLMLGLLVFFFIPIVWGLILSFSQAHSTLTPTGFAGFSNYQAMLNDPYFVGSLGTFFVFALFIVPTTFICALGLAMLVNSVKIAQGFFRLIFFLPTACSYVLASVIWKMNIFNGSLYGLANQVLQSFHLPPVDWVFTASPPLYWIVLVTVRLWLQLGLYMIIFIAGLQEIPRELYEAAAVDGAAGGWKRFINITFPLLRNASISILLLNVIAAFQAFDEFYNIMSNGNTILARPPLVYLYSVALTGGNYGYGEAGAIILTIIIVCFTLLQGRLLGFGKAN
ncbi:MAG TPA: sugar ABC transporter permease [Ktedonobacteraceae bacterium]|jgi:multiple sugar transport system permease protein